MPITRTFTDGIDIYAARLLDTYLLHFRAGGDRLLATAGTITAYMGEGDDQVRIEGGLATIRGQGGADRFDLFADGANVDGGDGDDRFNIRGGTGSVLSGGAGNEHFAFLAAASDIRVVGGDGDDVFSGGFQAVSGRVSGGNGNDRFLDFGGAGGSPALLGGAGNDLYRLGGDAPSRVIELAGEGRDTVQVAPGTSYALGANVENLTVVGAGSEAATLRGNALANRITGSAGSEDILGLGGNDVLIGGDGDDSITGGTGNDRIYGGGGLDLIDLGVGGRDVLVYTAITDALAVENQELEIVLNWEAQDTLDLSAIDANNGIAGDQAFNIVGIFGTPAGPQEAGTAVLAGFGGELYVMLFVEGGSDPDMVIAIGAVGGEAALANATIIV